MDRMIGGKLECIREVIHVDCIHMVAFVLEDCEWG